MEKKGVWMRKSSKTVLLLMIVIIFTFLISSPIDMFGRLSETLTGNAITTAVSLEDVDSFNLDLTDFSLILAGLFLLLLIFLIGKLSRKRKTGPIVRPELGFSGSKDENWLPSGEKKAALKKWQGKKELSFSEELDLIDQELSSLRKMEPEKGKRIVLPPSEIRTVKPHKIIHFKPPVLKLPEKTFQEELSAINKKLSAVGSAEVETVKVKTVTPTTKGISRTIFTAAEKRKLEQTSRLLEPSSGFLARIFKKKKRTLSELEKPAAEPEQEPEQKVLSKAEQLKILRADKKKALKAEKLKHLKTEKQPPEQQPARQDIDALADEIENLLRKDFT